MRDDAGRVNKTQLIQGLLVMEFGIYPETNGERLMSFEKWRNIICLSVNVPYGVENGFEVVKTRGLLEQSEEG